MRTSQPGPGGQANTTPWRRWVFPAVAAAGLLALLAVPHRAPGMPLAYSRFTADVAAGMVRAVTISRPGR